MRKEEISSKWDSKTYRDTEKEIKMDRKREKDWYTKNETNRKFECFPWFPYRKKAQKIQKFHFKTVIVPMRIVKAN